VRLDRSLTSMLFRPIYIVMPIFNRRTIVLLSANLTGCVTWRSQDVPGHMPVLENSSAKTYVLKVYLNLKKSQNPNFRLFGFGIFFCNFRL